ncbi:MAG: DUF1987 domain-containing protein [Candidatus Puniceispirillales bacterium]
MPDLMLEKTSRTPLVVIDTAAGLFKLEGESYPEDIAGFFTPIRSTLEESFSEMDGGLKVEINLVYFNSSSARVLMEILDQLEERASGDFPVSVNWVCDPDDDITREFAEDISEDLETVQFTITDTPRD